MPIIANKFISRLLTAVFILLLPPVLLLTSVQVTAFDRQYYRDEYIKYGIPEQVGIGMDGLMDATDRTIGYLAGRLEDLNFKESFANGEQEFFSERDKLHMIDVKGLFVKGRILRNIALLYLLAFLLVMYFRKKPGFAVKLANCGIYSFVAGIIPIIILVILMNIDFYKYFTAFHHIFFTNDLWLLDPAKDRLVNIFPQDFFTDMAFRISYQYMGGLAVLLLAGISARKLRGFRH